MVLWLETRSIWPSIVLPAAVGLRDPVDGAEDDDEDGGDEGEAHQVHAVHHEQRVAPIQRLDKRLQLLHIIVLLLEICGTVLN